MDALGVVLLVVDCIGWIINLSGLATVTDDVEHSWTLGLEWWAVWFQFVTLLLVVATAFTASTPPGWSKIRRDCLVMVTVLMMVTADQAQVAIKTSTDSNTKKGAEAQLAGIVIQIVFNFFLMVYFALDLGENAWRQGPDPKAVAAGAAAGGTAAAGPARPGQQLQFPVRASV